MDCSQPGSPVRKILQARILEWVVVPFSRGSSQPRNQTGVTCVVGRPFTNWAMREAQSHSVVSDSLRPRGLYSPWNSLGQNTGVAKLFLSQGDLPNPGIKPRSPALWVDSLPTEPPGKPTYYINICQILRHLRDIFSRIVAAKVISGGDDWNLVCNINYWKDFVM